MKFKGKKSIMAAVLSAIVATASFGTTITASAEATYACLVDWTDKTAPSGFGARLIDDQGNDIRNTSGSNLCTPGKKYIMRFYIPLESGKVLSRIYIVGDESSVVYPNSADYYDYKFVMPEHRITFFVEFKDASPTPAPTPTPDPTPSPTWEKGDANCDGRVTAEDATAVLKHLAGIIALSEQGCKNADMDANDKVTAADATAILKLLVSKS
ncbi:MAG: dockerin type I repeat-containing protein [Oscillospiraceae bacterium]|nr:dockerin type I repeat-containing protein [Oscillospiraceae bacterium]